MKRLRRRGNVFLMDFFFHSFSFFARVVKKNRATRHTYNNILLIVFVRGDTATTIEPITAVLYFINEIYFPDYHFRDVGTSRSMCLVKAIVYVSKRNIVRTSRKTVWRIRYSKRRVRIVIIIIIILRIRVPPRRKK